MELKDITSKQSEESIELIKAGRRCKVKVYLLNGEYKIIHVFHINQNRVSVSHIEFKEVPNEIIKYLVEDYLDTFESNIYLFTLGDSPIIHIHHEQNKKFMSKEEKAHDYKS